MNVNEVQATIAKLNDKAETITTLSKYIPIISENNKIARVEQENLCYAIELIAEDLKSDIDSLYCEISE